MQLSFSFVPRCAKCGSKDISTYYREANCCQSRQGEYRVCRHIVPIKEHLHRSCKTCHYMWIEDTIDPVRNKQQEVG